MSELDNIVKRRAEISKKISKLQELIEEDKELEVAQRVLERMAGVKQESSVDGQPKPAAGSESIIMDMLTMLGDMEVDQLQGFVPKLTTDSYKSILSRMKKKGLIERKGSKVFVKTKEAPEEASKELGKALIQPAPYSEVNYDPI